MTPYRRYRSYKRSNRDKYSVERTSGSTTISSETTSSIVVASNAIQGMRKVKHMEISFSNTTTNQVADSIYWALVYVPQGTVANSLNTTGSTYEPNQFVIEAGVLDFTGGPLRIRSRLARNLNSGDSIHLLMRAHQLAGDPPTIAYVVKYAVTLQ